MSYNHKKSGRDSPCLCIRFCVPLPEFLWSVLFPLLFLNPHVDFHIVQIQLRTVLHLVGDGQRRA